MHDVNPDLQQMQRRLSSWRHEAGTVEHSPELLGEPSINEAQVRLRQRRIATMCLNTVRAHDAFLAELKAYVEKGGRDPIHQQRVEDEAAFALGVFEQTSARVLEKGIINESDNLPKEVIETVYVQPPPPPKSWFQRVLGI
jgi:hypothetical protein